MKKISMLLICPLMLSSLYGCGSNSSVDASDSIQGTYSYHVSGFDWGACVSSITLNLNKKVNNVSVDDFIVSETEQTTDWQDEALPLVETTIEKTITDAYLADENGEKIDESSQYVVLEFECTNATGSPIVYDAVAGYNRWSDPFYLDVKLSDNSNLTSNDTKVTSFEIDEQATSKTSDADAFDYDSFTATDGVTYQYAYHDADSDVLLVWLHGGGEGGTEKENTDPSVTLLSNKATSLISEEFQEVVGDVNVLVPQSPTCWMDETGDTVPNIATYQANTGTSFYEDSLFEFISSYKETIGAKKVIVAGCSNGGFMTLKLALDHPDAFDAIVPVCESLKYENITTEQLKGIKDLPMYFIYSNNDTVVDPDDCERPTIEKLKELNASNLSVATVDSVVDLSEINKTEDGKPYEYMGHWVWIYFYNNTISTSNGVKPFEWIAQQID